MLIYTTGKGPKEKMLLYILFLFIGFVFGVPSCIHDNHDRLTAEHVLDQVVSHADHDRNGVVSISEIISEFISRFDQYPNDTKIEPYEFVYSWEKTFRDVPCFAEYLFLHLDRNHDKIFGAEDITPLYDAIDADKDGVVTIAEFRSWFEKLYRDCVPVEIY